MLSKIADKLDVRYAGRSIDLQHLDITSYLSAPNRINTCNTHIGTVYRIFTDLSDMDWEGKHTLSYNKETHSMDKIVQVFAPKMEKGKADEVEPKVLEVVDWPVTAGLTGDAEYNDLFKWAEHLKNYHTEVMNSVHNKVPKGYHPIRYQTKVFDECTKILSVFTQDEREFLQRFRWLREMKDFFKPKNLCCIMNNVEDEEKAEQMLQDFKLDNESVCCPDASKLHGLIPYLKRLVRLFPCIK
jgi:hypothetical protein